MGKNLKTFIIPKHVWTIGLNSFYKCTNLDEIIIESNSFYLPPNSFKLNKFLKYVKLQGIDSIHQNTFQFCQSLTKIDIPTTVTSIGNFAFENCINLIEINIPQNVEKLGIQCFGNCYKLEHIKLSNNIIDLPHLCFHDCKSLISIEISNKTQKLGEGTFQFCYSLSNINIPSTLTSIGGCCFIGCSQLTSIIDNLKYSLKEIGRDALSFYIKGNDKNKTNENEYLVDYEMFGKINKIDDINEIYNNCKIIENKEMKEIYSNIDSPTLIEGQS